MPQHSRIIERTMEMPVPRLFDGGGLQFRRITETDVWTGPNVYDSGTMQGQFEASALLCVESTTRDEFVGGPSSEGEHVGQRYVSSEGLAAPASTPYSSPTVGHGLHLEVIPPSSEPTASHKSFITRTPMLSVDRSPFSVTSSSLATPEPPNPALLGDNWPCQTPDITEFDYQGIEELDNEAAAYRCEPGWDPCLFNGSGSTSSAPAALDVSAAGVYGLQGGTGGAHIRMPSPTHVGPSAIPLDLPTTSHETYGSDLEQWMVQLDTTPSELQTTALQLEPEIRSPRNPVRDMLFPVVESDTNSSGLLQVPQWRVFGPFEPLSNYREHAQVDIPATSSLITHELTPLTDFSSLPSSPTSSQSLIQYINDDGDDNNDMTTQNELDIMMLSPLTSLSSIPPSPQSDLHSLPQSLHPATPALLPIRTDALQLSSRSLPATPHPLSQVYFPSAEPSPVAASSRSVSVTPSSASTEDVLPAEPKSSSRETPIEPPSVRFEVPPPSFSNRPVTRASRRATLDLDVAKISGLSQAPRSLPPSPIPLSAASNPRTAPTRSKKRSREPGVESRRSSKRAKGKAPARGTKSKSKTAPKPTDNSDDDEYRDQEDTVDDESEASNAGDVVNEPSPRPSKEKRIRLETLQPHRCQYCGLSNTRNTNIYLSNL
ncbi:hypothetical protein CONPUDRAFT_151682 [Coniophora puteana RWD-64-598 SS2]|uniref:Uncharacterized protein n=1 Tax=Coniophora puteana (strain RWD-64-598) TaxID=741705 RepID=A0A5M3MTX0_CONPW|nr:uncharacterized protein CONPUDRAFT_151682 [Coniophora puteana RWD-64-598 SS2]EIW82609.1 hypothetical protein CONPUDRAFT_151682 [Coniophora puteana RWD-64-598 SS2]